MARTLAEVSRFWSTLLHALARLTHGWLLLCGLVLNLALAVATWIALDEGAAGVWSRVEQIKGNAVTRARVFDELLREQRGRRQVAKLGLATPHAAEPVVVEGAEPVAASSPRGRVLRVGPRETYRTPGAAARIARDGDRIEIEAGHYVGESLLWKASHLVIQGRGGLAHIDATGVPLVQEKAAWLIQGDDVRIEQIAFRGARSRDRNGAGIRAEGRRLVVNRCAFIDNETGLLSNNVAGASIAISNSTFSGNGHADGQAHQIYIGSIGRFELRGSYLHATRVGSAVKSRAEESIVTGNRIVDGADGRSNYTLDFSLGGRAIVVGNEFEQGPFAGNRRLVAFAPEGSRGAADALVLAHNTLVDDRGHGIFVWNRGANPAVLVNNLFVGGRRVLAGAGWLAGNVFAEADWGARWGGEAVGANRRADAAGIRDRAALDYRLMPDSPAIDAGNTLEPETVLGADPLTEYVHPAQTRLRQSVGAPDAGAREFGVR